MTAVKTIETRSWAAPKGLVGRTLIIHAAKRAPIRDGTHVGDYSVYRPLGKRPLRMWGNEGHQGPVTLLPLGKVVGSARLAGCVPIVEYGSSKHTEAGFTDYALCRGPDGTRWPGLSLCLWASAPAGAYAVSDVSDQLPYGDFTPGRWAWLLEDAQPCEKRCPACGGSGITGNCGKEYLGSDGGCVLRPDHFGPCYGPGDVASDWSPVSDCRACDGKGTCDPIPAKGGQRVWRWNGLPALTLWQPWASLCVTKATS